MVVKVKVQAKSKGKPVILKEMFDLYFQIQVSKEKYFTSETLSFLYSLSFLVKFNIC